MLSDGFVTCDSSRMSKHVAPAESSPPAHAVERQREFLCPCRHITYCCRYKDQGNVDELCHTYFRQLYDSVACTEQK